MFPQRRYSLWWRCHTWRVAIVPYSKKKKKKKKKKMNFVGTYKHRAEYKAGFEGSTHTERFYRSNRPGYPHPVCSELETNGVRLAVGDCGVIEHRRWRPTYQTGKTVHVHAKTLQTQRGRTHGAECPRPWFYTTEPLGEERRYENWITTTIS